MAMNHTTITEFDSWLTQIEGQNLEFKTAKNSFNESKDLPDYCAALANEGGGKLILGVDPLRSVVGTKAFHETYNTLSNKLLSSLGIKIDVEELKNPKGRVLIFHIPSRPPGQPVKSTGKYRYPMRAGESLVEMDSMTLKAILNETMPDFSSKIVERLSLSDMDETALETFKVRWIQKAGRQDYRDFTVEKMLRNIGIMSDDGINYAGLILFAKKEKIDRYLPGSEIIFEWRQAASKIAHDFRINWREPFFKIYNEIWSNINARNLRIPFQEGLFQREIFAYSEKPIREAVLNAVAHRDYNISTQSIFITASPEKFTIESPGGFLPGITPENVLYKREWRNRCIAETLEKAGLVERSGQGMDDIFEQTIREGKGLPDLSKSDNFSVRLIIPAQVKDRNFVLFLEKITNEKQITLSFEEIYQLEIIREKQPVTKPGYKDKFLEYGIIEPVGKTRGRQYILSHRYYVLEGALGIHTRLTGLSRDQKKELIINHLKKNKKGLFAEFLDAFSDLKPKDVENILQELRKAKRIKYVGSKRSGYWVLTEFS
jgi:ATP-dependent DNA helicase RecG